MEGSYKRIVNSRQLVPASEYLIFMDILLETMREEIGDSMEAAYEQLSLGRARDLLFMQKDQDLQQFIQKRKWPVVSHQQHNSVIDFDLHRKTILQQSGLGSSGSGGSGSNAAGQLQQQQSFEETSRNLIRKTLTYAKEMERII
jgi:hypothetical protein